MGWDTRMKHVRMCAAFAASAMLSVAMIAAPCVAQQAPAAKAAAKPAAPAAPGAAETAQRQKEAEAAKRAYEFGVKSYAAGKFEPAVQSLSAALRGGGLTSQDMARGLYYRGLAYKKQSKPGLAISDLTSALWLKNGLNDTDRQSATTERAEAYKLAGLGDGNSGAETVAVADPNAKSQTAAVPSAASAAVPAPSPSAAATDPAPVAAASSSSSANDSGIPNPFAVTEGPPPKVSRQAAASPTQGPSGAPGASKSTDGAFDQAAALEQPRTVPGTAPVAQTAPAAAVPAPIPEQAVTGSSNNTVSGFFSNLFGGGGEAPAQPAPGTQPAPVTTASTNQPAAVTSSWTDTTSVASGAKAKAAPAAKVAPPVTTAAVAPPAAAQKAVAPAQAQVKGGKFKLHIAAMRSRPEAEALAQKLSQQYGNQLAARPPTVDEAVIGSMGTFYRVRVGSYATADEPRGLCNTLRNSGYDCLVVTN